MTAPEAAPRPRRSRWLAETVLLVVLALTVATLVRAFVVQAFFIPSGSMENTLLVGDRIVVNRLGQHLGSLHRGEVVVFRDPGGWLPPQAAGAQPLWRKALEFVGLLPAGGEDDLVKRVIGIGGDHVKCCDQLGRVTVNGVPLSEKSYLYPGNRPGDCPKGICRFDVRVPIGSLWVMGDHRAVSEDSRLQPPGKGFVPESDVVGRAVLVFWPPGRLATLPIPSTFDQAGISGSGS